MIWQRLRNLNSMTLGAINGLLFVFTIESTLRVFYLRHLYEEKLLQASLENDVNICIVFIVSFDFRWYFGLFLVLVSTTLASFLVNRSLPHLKEKPILLWQIIGFFSLAILVILTKVKFLASEFAECRNLNCSEFSIVDTPGLYYRNLLEFAFVLVVILSFNFIFSLFLRERRKHYS